MMFRTNYLPKGTIYKDSKTGKYFMRTGNGSFDRTFVQYGDGKFSMSVLNIPTMFDSVDELLEAMYEYACKNHLEHIHRNITYSKGIQV